METIDNRGSLEIAVEKAREARSAAAAQVAHFASIGASSVVMEGTCRNLTAAWVDLQTAIAWRDMGHATTPPIREGGDGE